ncbi:osmoprotectant ABC transporter substrate-binding protein [Paenibacillus sp. N1-5-1-14]|uniref:glycine betaine ABC transporter substrate-binding protein n=1 Tax=Paenibacillus radicibacter TaxID=2972488 RepID=UPI0021591185|nr:glycine betaine ABC transporter substrate-binding protein [Paenibacillus radicibacter]MCR8642480.1 osmoprotectant ABC transporter substrate-binding protein [Paenibacillus radicibacter]
MHNLKLNYRWGMIIVILTLISTLTACGNKDLIRIGTQTYSEPKIIAQMYKLLIEDRTNLKVDVLPDLASSAVIVGALNQGDIQLATLYSGEIFNNYFPVQATNDRAEVLRQAQEGFLTHYNFNWFNPYGFENTYAFTMREEVTKQDHIEQISDLTDTAKNYKLGVDTTWLEREQDGYKAFTKKYNLAFGKTIPMEIALVYQAVATGNVDIVLAYTTDARLKAYKLKSLKDDKHFFPPYDASPVMRKDLLDKHPELAEIIGLLIGKLSTETMIDLNYEVDVNKRNEKKVAEDYLKKLGLLK